MCLWDETKKSKLKRIWQRINIGTDYTKTENTITTFNRNCCWRLIENGWKIFKYLTCTIWNIPNLVCLKKSKSQTSQQNSVCIKYKLWSMKCLIYITFHIIYAQHSGWPEKLRTGQIGCIGSNNILLDYQILTLPISLSLSQFVFFVFFCVILHLSASFWQPFILSLQISIYYY